MGNYRWEKSEDLTCEVDLYIGDEHMAWIEKRNGRYYAQCYLKNGIEGRVIVLDNRFLGARSLEDAKREVINKIRSYLSNKINEYKSIRSDLENRTSCKAYKWNNSDYSIPEKDKWVVVLDNKGVEHNRHIWNGICFYQFTEYDDEGCSDGYPSNVCIRYWRYDNTLKPM
ncbi:hypothetical protein [Clostridium sp. HBUAS56010]|uniref:hypothetical protein n=1 Tax=Clostridium sp. HBUAS56010 TaxID=2571127 RepID=UPI0011778A1C|nr:hypothetical protein [Clostridium sp. HBUAS56010]